jgi:hypothetical protein
MVLGCVLLFLASVWLVRWHNIARPNREFLRARIEIERVRFQNADLDELLKAAEEAIGRNSWFDFLFWTRGQEITGWARVHEFQRGSIQFLPVDAIRARLQTISLDLDNARAAAIKDALAVQPANVEALRALLKESLTYLNDQTMKTFAQLVGWQTKAVWLAGLGGGLIVLLASAVGNPVLFLAGATGGYLSRLARALKRADVPTDYGASWTTLFLSPIVGALSGWFGILLIVVLADARFSVLGGAFQAVKWESISPISLGLAFALGFSERLFDGIMAGLEDLAKK